jgi:hypothetical protein
MVYEVFKKRDGKRFGPYYYESFRGKDGKVHKKYLGANLNKGKNKLFYIIPVVFLVLLSAGFFLKITGFAVLGSSSMDDLIVNSTYGSNFSIENITAYPIGLSGDVRAVIYNWLKNNQSMTVLNLPFENDNSISISKTKDYALGNNGSVIITGNNLAANPGFEEQQSGYGTNDAANWVEGGGGRASDRQLSGEWSMKSTQRMAAASDYISVTPNTDYVLSGWVYNTLSSGNAYLDLYDIAEECSALSNIKNNWEYVSCKFRTGASRNEVRIRLVVDNDGDVWFDDISLSLLSWNSTAGIRGGAYQFDGVNDYIDMGNSPMFNLKGNFTIEAWIKTNSSKIQGIFSKYKQTPPLHYNSLLANKKIEFWLGSGAYLSSTTYVTNNSWYYIAMMQNDTEISLLVNGNIEDIKTSISIDSENNFLIGSLYGSNFFNGTIDEFKVYNYSLSPEQIKQNYFEALNKLNTSTIVSQEIKEGENWTAKTWANNGTFETFNSKSIIIRLNPNITSFVLNSTFGMNRSDEDFTAYWSTLYPESIIIYNWLKNNQSMAILNLPFEGGSNSTFTRDYASGNNGSVQGAFWNSTGGVKGGAYQFDGINDYIQFDKNILNETGSDFSIEIVLKNNHTLKNYYSPIFSTVNYTDANKGIFGSIEDSGKLFFNVKGFTNNWIRGSKIISDNLYHDIIFSAKGTSLSIYVDGVLDARKDVQEVNKGNMAFVIGQQYFSESTIKFFNGTIDYLGIYNYSINSEEAYQKYLEAFENLNKTVLASKILSRGDNLSIQALLNDRYRDWLTIRSTSISILNGWPFISSLTLNSTGGQNTTAENITAFSTYGDYDNDNVTVIYNWMKNNNSLASLNLPFEGGSNSTFTRDYASGNNGSVQGAFWNSTGGVKGGAYKFDGRLGFTSVINIIDNIRASKNVAIEAWININNIKLGETNFIAGKWTDGYQSYGLWIESRVDGNYTCFGMSSTGSAYNKVCSNANAITPRSWHYVAGVFNGSDKIVLYVNDQKFIDNSYGYLFQDDRDISIGARKSSSGYYMNFFNGTIDEVKIYNYSLSSEQIKQNYLDGIMGFISPIMSPQETEIGDNWTIQAWANDGITDGAVKEATMKIMPTPYLVIHAPLNISYYNTATILFRVESNVPASWCGISLDNGYNKTMTSEIGSLVWNYGNNTMTIGGHNAFFMCNDTDNIFGKASVSFSIKNAPWIENLAVNSTYGTDYEFENLTAYADAKNVYGGPARALFNWFKNSNSIMTLNLPFEANEGNENSNNKDCSFFNNQLSFYGTFWNSTAGIRGGAYQFDGSYNTYISIAGAANIVGNNPRTICAWAYPKQFNGGEIFSTAGTNKIALQTNNTYEDWKIILNSSYYFYLNIPNSINRWGFFCFTHNGSVQKIYYNGDLKAEKTGALNTDIGSLRIGYHFNGTIDEVKEYNISLSNEQIKQFYYEDLNGINSSTIVSQEIRKGENWSVQAIPSDSIGYGNSVRSNEIEINPRDRVVLHSPENGIEDYKLRTPVLQWHNVMWDEEKKYEVEIYNSSELTSNYIVYSKNNIEQTNSKTNQSVPELAFDNVYYWRVRAYNDSTQGTWSKVWNFSVPLYIAVSLPANSIDFGAMDVIENREKDTTNGYNPMKIRNDGNVRVDVAINGSYIWETKQFSSDFFQYKIREDSEKPNSFEILSSTMNWKDLSSTNSMTDIDNLKYIDANDSALIDFKLKIPSELEPIGKKKAEIVFYAQCHQVGDECI